MCRYKKNFVRWWYKEYLARWLCKRYLLFQMTAERTNTRIKGWMKWEIIAKSHAALFVHQSLPKVWLIVKLTQHGLFKSKLVASQCVYFFSSQFMLYNGDILCMSASFCHCAVTVCSDTNRKTYTVTMCESCFWIKLEVEEKSHFWSDACIRGFTVTKLV